MCMERFRLLKDKHKRRSTILSICPLCNSLTDETFTCPSCQDNLIDYGKITDFLDPYGHYNDDDTLKMADGFYTTEKENKCPHLFYCVTCNKQYTYLIKEIDL